MAKSVLMPKLGQTVEESTIVHWLKNEGDSVRKGDILLEIETDKAVLEVESFVEGTLLKILKGEGETVPVMEPIAFVGEPGEALPRLPVASARPERKAEVRPPHTAEMPRPVGVPVPADLRGPRSEKISPRETQAKETIEPIPSRLRISPRAAKLARDSVIDPRPIHGTGPEGRIVEKDVSDYLRVRGYDRLRITPAAKQLAARHGLDVLTLQSGEDGRVRTADVEQAVYELPIPMSRIRRVTAQRLTRSFSSTPHFYVTVSADMTDLVGLRSTAGADGKEFKFNDFIMKAVVLALGEFPLVNSSTPDGENMCRHRSVHLGLAVAIEGGLVVPVIHHADKMRLQVLHDRAEELIGKARAGRLTLDEMTGGTFTISNMGMLEVENFSAIINPGESAILAVSSIRKKPAVRDDQLAIRSMMKMTLSVDHRLVDGVLAARFANDIKSRLEDIELWKRLM